MKVSRFFLIVVLAVSALSFYGCNKKDDDAATSSNIEENAQNIGDVMASVDESGKGTGSISYEKTIQKIFERYAPGEIDRSSIAKTLFLPDAMAASCGDTGYGSCSGNTMTRTFPSCTVGLATFTGSVSLAWGAPSTNCGMTGAGATITRDPNITVTGRRNATLTIVRSGTFGQRMSLVSTGPTVLSFESDGIRRKFAFAGTTYFDTTTSTTSPITITGADRSSRVMTGGTLRLTNNLSSVTCDFTPTNVTWSTTACNCPVSGSWGGTCSDGSSTTLNLTGCGTATYTQGSETTNVNFDRCGT